MSVLKPPIEVSQGGTGATDASTARTNLGLGTIATQNSNNVSITGGSITGITGLGNLVLIQSQTASNSATIDFTTGFTYTNYMLVFNNVVPVTDAVDLRLLISNNGGSSYVSTNYLSGIDYSQYNSATVTNSSNTAYVYLAQAVSNVSGRGAGGVVFCTNLNVANYPTFTGHTSYTRTSPTLFKAILGATNTATTGVNALRFLMSSGNISSGTFTLFGLKDS